MNRIEMHKEFNPTGNIEIAEVIDKVINNFKTVYVVEQYDNIPYGEQMGIKGVYVSEKVANSFESKDYDFIVTDCELK